MTAYQIVIISPAEYVHAQAFQEIAESLHYAFAHLGMDAPLRRNQIDPSRCNIIFGIHLLHRSEIERLPENTIIYNLEQVHSEAVWLNDSLKFAAQRFKLWDYSQKNTDEWRVLGVTKPVDILPIAYVPELTRIATQNEDIDVLFYGSVNERRAAVLQKLKAAGLNVHIAFGVYGAERDALIARAKIVLNIHSLPTHIFEIVRVSYLLANRKAVVAECQEDTEIDPALKPGLCLAAYDEIVAACKRLLASPEERMALAERGYQAMRQQRLDRALERIVGTSVNITGSFTSSHDYCPDSLQWVNNSADFNAERLNVSLDTWQRSDMLWRENSWQTLLASNAENAQHVKVNTERFGILQLTACHFRLIDAGMAANRVEDLPFWLSCMHWLLKPGGMLVLQFPHAQSSDAAAHHDARRHFNQHSWPLLLRELATCGHIAAEFTIKTLEVKLSPAGQQLQQQGQSQEAILMTPAALGGIRVELVKGTAIIPVPPLPRAING